MKEIGFWDYTAPGGGGGLEVYTRDDWDRLLDDMAAGGFNSIALGIKRLTTGYRSRKISISRKAEILRIGVEEMEDLLASWEIVA